MDTPLNKLAFGIASAGLIASTLVHAITWVAAPSLPPALVYALFAGAGVSCLLAAIVAPRPVGPPPWTHKDLRDAVLDAAPFEMRAAFYLLLGYSVLQFGLLVATLEPGGGALLSSTPVLRLLSSNWLLLYFSAITTCTAARRTPPAASPR